MGKLTLPLRTERKHMGRLAPRRRERSRNLGLERRGGLPQALKPCPKRQELPGLACSQSRCPCEPLKHLTTQQRIPFGAEPLDAQQLADCRVWMWKSMLLAP
ncbi:hypothetical protein QF035_007055 [Streptomyces umbrinus]|uniref:Uncharacterized protein n=1 Tax=Streptomyces umbrinus TaxID=67370 RepID=A0ABU0T0Y4_9ACTN|nr:hypothetical protein [Streptomyces umbrinus]